MKRALAAALLLALAMPAHAGDKPDWPVATWSATCRGMFVKSADYESVIEFKLEKPNRDCAVEEYSAEDIWLRICAGGVPPAAKLGPPWTA